MGERDRPRSGGGTGLRHWREGAGVGCGSDHQCNNRRFLAGRLALAQGVAGTPRGLGTVQALGGDTSQTDGRAGGQHIHQRQRSDVAVERAGACRRDHQRALRARRHRRQHAVGDRDRPHPCLRSGSGRIVDNDALKLKLQEALNKLVPQLKQAVVTYPEKKVELLTPVAQIKKQMDSGDLQEAKKGILAVGQLLKSVMAQNGGESQPQNENALRAEYERKLAAAQPSYAQALKDMIGDTSKFRTVMTYAIEQAEAGVYETAIKAIDRLAQAVAQAISAGPKRTDVVDKQSSGTTNDADRKIVDSSATNAGTEPWALSPQFDAIWERAKTSWTTAVETINVQLEELRGSLLDSNDSDLMSIADFGLNAITADHMVPLQASIFDVDRASGDNKIKAVELAQDAVIAFSEHVDRDERIDACDNNPFNVTVTLRSELSRGLTQLANALDEALI